MESRNHIHFNHLVLFPSRWNKVRIVAGTAFMAVLAGCSLIDEDLSDCGTQAEINYDLQLVTNMNTEIRTELTTPADMMLADALRTYLSGIFTDYAHDIDLSFYDTEDDSLRLHNDRHIMDASNASYTLFLPAHQYMHLTAANVEDNNIVGLANAEYCHPSMLLQTTRDTIDCHTTGLFTGRLPMQVLGGVDQQFNVHLYMANCAVCLVIDPKGHDASGIQVYSTGFATGFNICDSTYQFPVKSPIVRTQPIVPQEGGSEIGFCSVTFPSKEAQHPTRTVIETEEPFISQPGEEALWEFHVYVPQTDSASSRNDQKYTKNVLSVTEPLRAGELKIIKVKIAPDGSIYTDAPEVGVSVTLNWKPGGIYYPEI